MVRSMRPWATSTLKAFRLIGRATVRIAAAACLMLALMSLPLRASSTTFARYGTGATPPSTMRPSFHWPPSTVNHVATEAMAKS